MVWDAVMAFVAIILLIPSVVLCIQVLSACLIKTKLKQASLHDVSVAVLIPAHNESTGIIDTLNSIKPQLSANDRVLVVADNCADDTAQIARAAGVEVIERTNASQRGKGYALDFGVQHLKQAPCDVLVVVDADCVLEARTLQKLANYAHLKNRPTQALYLMYGQKNNQLKTSVAEFAWRVKNLVRPLGFANLNLPCQLMGTGMAFPWPQIANIDLANGNIVEDMKLGIDLASEGRAPVFYPEAKVTSLFPTESETQNGQSKRWEHGHLSMIVSEMPKLFVSGLKSANVKTIAMALDLSIPPLALLVLLQVSFAVMAVAVGVFFGVGLFAAKLSVISMIILICAIGMAWLRFGRDIISFKNILYIPIYILQKIPNHIGFIFKRQSAWNKTKREQDL